jgi:hypothetical protein
MSILSLLGMGGDHSQLAKQKNAENQASLVSAFANSMQLKNIADSKMSNAQKNIAGFDTGLNLAADVIPGIGLLGAAAIKGLNVLGGSAIKSSNRMKSYQVNSDVASSGAFTGTGFGANQAMQTKNMFGSAGLAGKLGGGKRANNEIAKSQIAQNQASGVINQSKNAFENMTSSAGMFDTRTENRLNGFNTNNLRMGKAGMKIDFKKIVSKFKKGGSLEKNVILDGVLHARKHDIFKKKEYKDAEITHKGIPVITKDGGTIEQHAEVEVGEIVLHKSLTKKLEELYKLGTDEAAIEAGKLLTKEILKNTKDKNKVIINS